MSTPTLIGLSGYAGAGKDAAAAALVADGWRRVAFADVLREFALSLNPLVPVGARNGAGTVRLQRLIEIIGWDRAKREHPEVRAFLQRLGTDAGRRLLGEDVWVEAAFTDVRPGERVVVTDVRFRSEAEAVRTRGGIVVRINRPGVGAVNGHVSEHDLDHYEHFAAHISNDGTLDDLHARVRAVLSEAAGTLIA